MAKLDRRAFLRASAMIAVGAMAASCSQPTPEVIEKEVEKVVKETVVVEKEVEKVVTVTAAPRKYVEPPILAGLVTAGQLPPVEERLPDEPMVLKPLESIGKYGGTLRTINDGTTTNWLTNSAYEKMLRWSVDSTTIEPNIVKQWEIGDGGKVFTLYLRKGMKWSDGAPFTADDVLFLFNDVWGNKELTPSYPTYMAIKGVPVVAEKLDDYTVRLTFAAPHGFCLNYLAYYDLYHRPAHYLKQFHAGYVDKAKLDAMVKEAGLETWMALYGQKDDWYSHRNPDLPVVMAWYPTSEAGSTLYIFKRNPYYWKVDTDGNQLPYIDEVHVSLVQDAEVLRLQTLAGKSDLGDRRLEFDTYTLLKENEDKGGYRVLLWDNPRGAVPAIMPNLTVKDPFLRTMIRDDRFRQALSHAINRPQINEIVFSGMGEPRQATCSTMSPGFKPEYASAFADYDPAKANALLDEMGLTKRGSDGFRLGPNGETLFLLIETPGEEPAEISQLELVAQQWKEVGVNTDLQPSERAQFRNRLAAGEVSIGMWQLDYVYQIFMPTFTVPLSGSCYWCPDFGLWYSSGGKSGEEPTGDIRQLQLIWDELQEQTDSAKQIEMAQQLWDLHMKHCWMIGIVGHVPRPVVVNKKIRNIPEKAIYSWTEGQYLGPARMEQLYYES
ncbi:MAG: ABC transporter substrate-binding protein [Chloroflexi bacterium]|nr:ABC transporter substrate-binding protein [Chloroflexota bacterium]